MRKHNVISTISLLAVISLFVHTETTRILAYFPVASISHQVVFRPLTQELARRGHEVVIITPNPAFEKGKAPENLKEIDVHNISYQIWNDVIVKYVAEVAYEPVNFMQFVFERIADIALVQLNDEEVKKMVVNNENFDLILTESCVRTALVVAHIFNAPVIQISSFPSMTHMKEAAGAPTHPIYYPEVALDHKETNSLINKLSTIYNYIRMKNAMAELADYESELIFKKYGESFPSVYELQENVDLIMFNVNPIWEGNHPYPPNVVLLGGLHQKPEKPLPKDLKEYLNSSKKGVIYMSFGTNVNPSNLPPERIKIFNKVFSKLPYDVLWKWDKEDMPGKADNVKIFKWLPQSDLLRHPKVKLFITQGGLQSTDESITAGVPLIAFPMLGDQWYNAEKYVYHKIGLHMDIETLTEESLEASIKKVIGDDSFRQNVVRLRTLMNDQPQTPLERAVWWTEYVIRHKGAKHLKSPMANISWAEYLVLDVLLLVIGVGLVILLIGSFVLCKLMSFLGSFGSQKSKLKNN